MRRVWMDKLLALAVTGALFMSNGVGIAATPQTTCKAAADIDKRVNYDFCVSQLLDHHESTMADTWGLAKIAALMGANNAAHAKADIDALLAKPGTGDQMKRLLGRCKGLYDRTFMRFVLAHEELKKRRYTSGKEKAAETVALVHHCDDAFVEARVRSPLTKQSADSVQLAIICAAITNLIK
ncbi:hypothetical protein ACQJBY_047340 [Aegilops geniculata]